MRKVTSPHELKRGDIVLVDDSAHDSLKPYWLAEITGDHSIETHYGWMTGWDTSSRGSTRIDLFGYSGATVYILEEGDDWHDQLIARKMQRALLESMGDRV